MAAPYVRFPKYPGKKVNETSKERWNRLWNKNETLWGEHWQTHTYTHTHEIKDYMGETTKHKHCNVRNASYWGTEVNI